MSHEDNAYNGDKSLTVDMHIASTLYDLQANAGARLGNLQPGTELYEYHTEYLGRLSDLTVALEEGRISISPRVEFDTTAVPDAQG